MTLSRQAQGYGNFQTGPVGAPEHLPLGLRPYPRLIGTDSRSGRGFSRPTLGSPSFGTGD